MTTDQIATGVVHRVPTDLRKTLLSSKKLQETWNSLTPLARNEWICWATIVKKSDTRAEHIDRLREDLLKGKRWPCCWPGCPHRNPEAKKWFKNLKAEKYYEIVWVNNINTAWGVYIFIWGL